MKYKHNYEQMTPVAVYLLVAKGDLKKFPNTYLNKERIKDIVRHIVLNLYGYTRRDILTKIDQDFCRDNYIGGFRKFFDGKLTRVLIYSFPELELKPWEFKKVETNFWKSKKNQKEFMLWVCEKEGLDYTKKEELRKVTANVVLKYGGSKPLVNAGGLYELLNTVACDKFKKWEIIKMSKWSKDDIIIATKWLVEEKLKLTPEEACYIKVEDFVKYNLDGMLQKGCNHSILKTLELAYPGMYYRTRTRGILLKK